MNLSKKQNLKIRPFSPIALCKDIILPFSVAKACRMLSLGSLEQFLDKYLRKYWEGLLYPNIPRCWLRLNIGFMRPINRWILSVFSPNHSELSIIILFSQSPICSIINFIKSILRSLNLLVSLLNNLSMIGGYSLTVDAFALFRPLY